MRRICGVWDAWDKKFEMLEEENRWDDGMG